ncbi:MAG: acyl-CoA dehydrogenase [Sporichthyaceae bacterium]
MSDGQPAPDAGATTEVDVVVLRRLLDGRWHEAREQARGHLRSPEFRPVHGLDVETHRSHVLAQAQILADSGHATLGFPERYGGQGDVGGSVTAFEMLAFADLSLLVKAGVQWGLFGGAILHLGTDAHHEAFLPRVLSLELLGCFAMTETGHGSDVQAIGTTATYDPESATFSITTPDVSARKDYIGNAARDGKMAAVFAQLVTAGESHGVHAFMVPIRDENGDPCPGVAIEDCGHKAGLGGVDNGRLTFTDVRVPRGALLNRYGDVAPDGTYSSPIDNENKRFFTMLGTLVQGRISVSGGAGAAARAALTIAVRYGERRRQFRPPGSHEEIVVLDYLAHQRRLLPALAKSYALLFAQNEMVAAMHDIEKASDYDRAQRELETRAAGIKAITTWHATATIQACREACGGAGYLSENLLPQLKADSDVFTTFEGDNTVLLQLVAKGLLTSYRDHFGELDALGTVRFVADQVVGAVIERTAARALVQRLIAAAPGRDEDADLLDRGYHLSLFEWREKHVINGLARRLRRAAGGNGDAFEAFNAAQDHLLLAARVHVDRVVLEAFVAAIDECEDEPAKALLGRVCDLYVLSNLEADRGWFLEHGRLTTRQSKAITRAVNELCRTLRPQAGTLVHAFGIPDESLPALATG